MNAEHIYTATNKETYNMYILYQPTQNNRRWQKWLFLFHSQSVAFTLDLSFIWLFGTKMKQNININASLDWSPCYWIGLENLFTWFTFKHAVLMIFYFYVNFISVRSKKSTRLIFVFFWVTTKQQKKFNKLRS